MFALTLTSTTTSFLYFILIIFLQVHAQLDDGSECSLKESKGTCKLLPNCIPVYKSLLAGNPPEKNCGYSGHMPLVCCPNEGDPLTTQPNKQITQTGDGRGAIAREKCREYSQYVYQLKNPPIFTVEKKPINTSTCGIIGKKLIVGGTKAIAKEFPHMVALGYKTNGKIEWSCGGSLISKRFILTAAHCLLSSDGIVPSVARVGDLNLKSSNDEANPKDYKIIERIRNPNYKPPQLYNDIALLKLETDVEFNEFVRPACLQTTLPDSPDNKATATGWGYVDWENETASDNLLKVTLDIVDYLPCNQSFSDTSNIQLNRGIIEESQICAGGIGKDTCQGDSGGPLSIFNKDHYCMYNVIGITSVGKLCGLNTPGVYTRVYNYISWLENTIWAEYD